MNRQFVLLYNLIENIVIKERSACGKIKVSEEGLTI